MLLGLALGVSACGAGREQLTGPPPGLPVAPIVRVGSGGSLYDAALLLAAGRGYFASEGLTVEVVELPAPSAVFWPLVAGQLDAGTSPPTVDLFGALAREHGGPRIVASAGQALPGQGAAAFLLRPDLAERAALNLRGRPIGADLYGTGGRNLVMALAPLHLSLDDVYLADLLPDQAAQALAEGQLDGAYAVEPDPARLVATGAGARWRGVDELEPSQELAVLLFSPNLVAHRSAIAGRVMAAYLRALRDYRAAVATSAGRAAVHQELAGALHLDDPRVLAHLTPVGYPPDGVPNVASLAAIQAHYLAREYVLEPADLGQAVDLGFLQTAIDAARRVEPPPEGGFQEAQQ